MLIQRLFATLAQSCRSSFLQQILVLNYQRCSKHNKITLNVSNYEVLKGICYRITDKNK